MILDIKPGSRVIANNMNFIVDSVKGKHAFMLRYDCYRHIMLKVKTMKLNQVCIYLTMDLETKFPLKLNL